MATLVPAIDMGTATLRSGDKMPLFGIGTWLAEPNVVGEAVKISVLQCGYRHVDCAAIYGNEKEIGEAFKVIFAAGVRREDLWITSKLWNNYHAPEDVRPAVMRTLADLGLTYLDLYLIHWPVSFRSTTGWPPTPADYIDIPTIATWRELEKCVDEGLIRNIGVSNFTAVKLEKFWAEARIKPAVNQVEMHPLLQQAKLREYCAFRGIHVTAYSSLGNNTNPFRGEFVNILENPTINRIARKHSKTPAQVLLRWAHQLGVSVIPKSTKRERLLENSLFKDFKLDIDDMASICVEDKHARMGGYLFLNGRTIEQLFDNE
ncbi:aldo/keto reductase [Pelomyxa schiedti]|nr:aldo/keto reductase [Pelomyxa schiedti]